MKDKPFHTVGHHVEGQRDQAWFEVMVNNRPLFKKKIPLSRVAARKIVTALNDSQKAVDYAEKHFPMRGSKA